MNILIIGHMRHGKTTVAEMFYELFGLTHKDSSEAAAEIFIYDELKEKFGYKSYQDCLADRKKRRDVWFQLICDYNSPDKSRLAKDILDRADIYCGMRSNEELQKCKEEGLFDLIIGVYRPLYPEEPVTSFDIDMWKECDFIIPNDVPKKELKTKINKLKLLFDEKIK